MQTNKPAGLVQLTDLCLAPHCLGPACRFSFSMCFCFSFAFDNLTTRHSSARAKKSILFHSKCSLFASLHSRLISNSLGWKCASSARCCQRGLVSAPRRAEQSRAERSGAALPLPLRWPHAHLLLASDLRKLLQLEAESTMSCAERRRSRAAIKSSAY